MTIILFALPSAQIFLFIRIIRSPVLLPPADVIVSYEGGEGRAQAAYTLAGKGYAPALVVSPADPRRLMLYDRRFNPGGSFETIVEEKARTTFENALYTKQIVDAHRFRTIILVTSWNHMPRSYLLLRMLAGADTTIYPYAVATGNLNPHNWHRHAAGWKMMFNELVKFWGSLVELLHFEIHGKVPDQAPGDARTVQQLKKLLLFNKIRIHP